MPSKCKYLNTELNMRPTEERLLKLSSFRITSSSRTNNTYILATLFLLISIPNFFHWNRSINISDQKLKICDELLTKPLAQCQFRIKLLKWDKLKIQKIKSVLRWTNKWWYFPQCNFYSFDQAPRFSCMSTLRGKVFKRHNLAE